MMRSRLLFYSITASILIFSKMCGQAKAAAESVCGRTDVGRPLGHGTPKITPHNSDEIVRLLGPPFWAGFIEDSEMHKRVDTVVYVDAMFIGSGDDNNGYLNSCGVEVVYQFMDGYEREDIRALLAPEIKARSVDDYVGSDVYDRMKNRPWTKISK